MLVLNHYTYKKIDLFNIYMPTINLYIMDPKNNLNFVSSYTPTFQDQVTLPNSPDKSMNILNNEPNNIKNFTDS